MLVYGFHSVQTLLEHSNQSIKMLYVNQARADKRRIQIESLAKEKNIKISHCLLKKLNDLTDNENHQGFVAEVVDEKKIGDERLLTAWLKKQSLKKSLLLVVFEKIQDSRNLGACLRSCQAADVDAVIITKNASASINEFTYKTASGALSTLSIFQISNLARVLKAIKQRQIWLIGLDGKKQQSIYQSNLVGRHAFVFGSEQKGLQLQTKQICDQLLAIPISEKIDSLNVSVATAVTLFEARRQELQ